jgi:hypothetical protein
MHTLSKYHKLLFHPRIQWQWHGIENTCNDFKIILTPKNMSNELLKACTLGSSKIGTLCYYETILKVI